MYNAKELVKEVILRNKFRKRNESEPIINFKLINKLESKRSNINLKFNITELYFPSSEFKNRSTKILFHDMVLSSRDKGEKSIHYRPIEEKTFNKIKKKEILYRIIPINERHSIFFRKLKPTPYEKLLAKKISFKNKILSKKYELNYPEINDMRIHPLSLPSNRSRNNFVTEKMFYTYNNKEKNKLLYLKKPQNFFNLSNVIHVENKIKVKKLKNIQL